MPQPFLGSLPSECSPHRNREPLSVPTSSHAVIHQRAETHLPGPYCRPFHQTPTLSRDGLAPRTTMSPLSTHRSTLPESPGSWAAEPPRSASFTYFEAFLLLRVRSHPGRVAPNRRPILSWVSAPLESSPPTPRILRPAQARGLEPAPSPEDSGTRLEGLRSPRKDSFTPPAR